MKKVLSRFGLVAAGVAVVTLTWVTQGTASDGQIIRVPEPGTLALLSAGAAALTLGARWFRRK